MRRSIVFVGLAMLTGVVLAATVFRNDVAKATGLAGSAPVTVTNTSGNPVPVKEQNLDGGNIRVHEEGTAAVHEQGTADVHVTNSTLTVAPQEPISGGAFAQFPVAASVGGTVDSIGSTITAMALSIHLDPGVEAVHLGDAAVLFGPLGSGNESIVVSLPRPISFDTITCYGTSGNCQVSWVPD